MDILTPGNGTVAGQEGKLNDLTLYKFNAVTGALGLSIEPSALEKFVGRFAPDGIPEQGMDILLDFPMLLGEELFKGVKTIYPLAQSDGSYVMR